MTLDEKALAAAKKAYLDTTYGRGVSDDVVEAAITAYLSAREAQGYVEVPVEPTPEMLDAGRRNLNGSKAAKPVGLARHAYRAMLAARPQKEG